MVNRRAFAAAQWKLPVVGIAAAGCIGLMIYQLVPNRSERTDIPKPSLVRADGTSPEPRRRRAPSGPPVFEELEEDAGVDYSFQTVSNASDVAEQMTQMADAIAAEHSENAGGNAVLGERVRTFLEPFNTGEQDSFAAEIADMGGNTEPDEEGRSPTDGIFTLFSGLLKFASLDTNEITVRKPTRAFESREGIAIGMNRDVSADPDTGEETEVVSSTISGSPTRLFPDAASEGATGELIELRLPFRSKGSKSITPDVVVLLQMRNVAGAGWQPAGFEVNVRNERLMDQVMKVMMARRGG